MIGSEEEVTKAVDDKGTVADDNFMELTQIVHLMCQYLNSMMCEVFYLVVREGLVPQKLVQ